MTEGKILIVDDEQSMREFLSIMLKKTGYEVETASGGKQARELIDKELFDVVISDISMPGGDGLTVLEKVRDVSPETPVILVTAYGSTESAVDAMKRGAYDYILKPFKLDELKIVIRNALERSRLEQENRLLKKQLGQTYSFGGLIGSSEAMNRVYELIERIKDTSTNVLIVGESGTGKEIVAKTIHYNSVRAQQPFVTVNCGAIPENLIESELFGHMKGAFTGATSNRTGLFEAAHGGTLFLDEIGEIPPAMQVKLLRAIQEKSIRRVGGNEDIQVDVRIIVATNKDLPTEIEAGRFREDLFYRLNVIQIRLPPLRERTGDVVMLANHFLEKYGADLEKPIRKISEEAMDALQSYRYPGNVRELENIIERAVALEATEVILPESLPPVILDARASSSGPAGDLASWRLPDDGIDLDEALGIFERNILRQALEKTNNVKKEAARLLGISFRSIRYRLAKYDMGGED